MIPASWFDDNVELIVELYSDLQTSIIEDIARRLAKTGRITDTAAWQIERANQAGLSRQAIQSLIAKYTGMSYSKVQKLFREAAVTTARYDDLVYKSIGLPPLPILQSPSMVQILTAGANKTQGQLVNLVRTITTTADAAFYSLSDLAHQQIVSGAFTYDQAMKNVCTELARRDIKVLDYESGQRISMEAGVRRMTLTGLNQTTTQITFTGMAERGCEHVQMSAHEGARNKGTGFENHELWQGGIFALNGFDAAGLLGTDYELRDAIRSRHIKGLQNRADTQYPDFVKATGFGDPRGYAGPNCRHSAAPYFPGVSLKIYTDEQVEKLANQTVNIDGEEIPLYDARQKQRRHEREIRKAKKEVAALEAAKQDAQMAKAKLREWQKRRTNLVKQMGVKPDYAREKVF